ncbi:Dihydroorotate dehydrogenase (quinone), mitochondrial [Orbilia blumenaviensis]|uniref:Dihydroorotate dehydrogenase (Quinone), mitochondrial n=1 Tax=Orbilia blumenaviensis TaxID=1796055 RepID=A0AAV9V4J2_9PEZI
MSPSHLRPLLRPRAFTGANGAFSALRQPSAFQAFRRTYATKKTPLSTTGTVVKSTIAITTLALFGYYATDSRAAVHRYFVVPALRVIAPDAEDAHALGLKMLRVLWDYGLHPRDRLGMREEDDKEPFLETYVWDKRIINPIYISAGLDKNAEAVDALFALGPSIIEVGCVTPQPQTGNARPRVFRLVADKALINRYGFNSLGSDYVARKLRERVLRYAADNGMTEQDVLDNLPASLYPGKLLAVQIGKNKSVSEDDIEGVKAAYISGVKSLGLYADVLVVNVSSPNTPGLRKLQSGNTLTELLSAVVVEAKKVDKKEKPRVIVKISPDESSKQQIDDITSAIKRSGVDGVVVANTTLRRPDTLVSPPHLVHEAGGLSGPELFDTMRDLVKEYRRRLPRDKEIWASGGVSTGQDALDVLKEGAGVVGVYTAMIYGGAGTIGRIKEEIREIVRTTIAKKEGGK